MGNPHSFLYTSRSKYKRKQCRRLGSNNLIQRLNDLQQILEKIKLNHLHSTLVQKIQFLQSTVDSILFDFPSASHFLFWIVGSSQMLFYRCLYKFKTLISNYDNFKSWIVLPFITLTYWSIFTLASIQTLQSSTTTLHHLLDGFSGI